MQRLTSLFNKMIVLALFGAALYTAYENQASLMAMMS